MLQNIKQFLGGKLGASDGDIGHIKDFLFDDETWVVRFLVVDTGSWLIGREILLSPHSFGRWDAERKILGVNLTRKQIENSPSPESRRPVSRQYEIEFYRYYGWPTYWEGGDIWGMGAMPLAVPPVQIPPEPPVRHRHRDDKHLRSARAVQGHVIHATDGEIGHVADFRVDDRQWTIHDLVVATGRWFSGQEILIPVGKVGKVSYEKFKVDVALTQADIRRAREGG